VVGRQLFALVMLECWHEAFVDNHTSSSITTHP
jgi:hypothetical protein